MEGNNLLLSILMFILGLIIGIGAIILIKYLKEKKDKKVADSIIIAAKNEAEKLLHIYKKFMWSVEKRNESEWN